MNRVKLNEMLQNLGDRVIQATEGGARRLGEFDKAYADKVYEMIGAEKSNPLVMLTSAVPLREAFPQDMQGNRMLQAQKYGAIGANIASRYALPVGAAVGLQQALAGLYNAASDQPIIE